MLKPINEGSFLRKYDLEIGQVSFYKNFLVIEVAEGISFNQEKAKQLSKLTDLHFENRPFGYISNRINSYSLEPMDYLKIKEILPNIKAFAVVAYTNSQKASVRIENMFHPDGLVTFEHIDDAVTWIEGELK